MTESQIRARYLAHAALHKFSEQLFFAFSALLIYAKTGSLLGTLLFFLVGNVASLLMKSIGFGPSVALFRRWGLMPSMTFGLVLKVLTLAGIFYLPPGYEYFYLVLFLMHAMENAGNVLYVTGANAIMLEVIGASDHPSRSSAQVITFHIASGLLAVLAGVWFNAQGSFLHLLLLGGLALLGSTIPLRGMPMPDLPRLSFGKNLRTVSLSLFLANINPNYQIRALGLPLVVLTVLESFDTSVGVIAGVALVSMAAAYAAGRIEDRGGAWLIWSSLALGIVAWVAYGFVRSPLGFLVASVLASLATEAITIGREARMSSELRHELLGGTMAFEFARSIGMLLGTIILVGAYLFVGHLPQVLLAIGGLFLIPKAFYAAGYHPTSRRP